MIKKKILKNKKGLTLIEMMMAIAIFTIGIGGFTALFAKTWKTNSYVLEMGQSTFAVSQSLNKLAGYIKSAQQGDDGSYTIQLANDNEFVVFSDYDKDGAVERLHFYKFGQSILMGIANPTTALPKTYPANDQETITLISNIVNDSSTPIFYYYNKDYPLDTANNPVATPALPASVRLLKIYFQTNISSNQASKNIEMQSFIEIRNLNDYDRI